MGNQIPTRSRRLVRERDNDSCQRCGGPGSQWHHRRRRNVRNGHYQHCACLGILACGPCHDWIHAHPKQAIDLGFIVSSYEQEPWTVPYRLPQGDWQLNDCDGGYQIAAKKEDLT